MLRYRFFSRWPAVAITICLLFVSTSGPTTANQTNGADVQHKSIVDAKRKVGSLTTWVTALESAGLANTLERGGPVTVFAPSDDAFAKLPPGTLEQLLNPRNRQQLVSVLNYHVVPGKLKSATVDGREIDLETADGIDITVYGVTDLKVNDAKVLIADIEAANGVIHVIDRVVVPH